MTITDIRFSTVLLTLKLLLVWTELLKAADMQTQVCAKFSRICANVCLSNATVVKMTQISCFLHNLTKFSFNFTCFYGIFSACLCAKFYFENSVCTKYFAFRRSDLYLVLSSHIFLVGHQMAWSDQSMAITKERKCLYLLMYLRKN